MRRVLWHGGSAASWPTHASLTLLWSLARPALAASVLLVAVQFGAWAAEPTSELPTGGLIYAGLPDLVTNKEDILIEADRIRAAYEVRNTAAEPRTFLIAFAMPDVDMLALDGSDVVNPAFDPQNPANYVGFTALIDGQPVETYVETRALALGLIDGTAVLRTLNLPLYPLTADIGEKLAALPEASRNDLAARGLIRFNDGQWEPLWRLKTTLFWQQPFAAGQTHSFDISYRPIVGTSAWTVDAAPTLMQHYCVPPDVASQLAKRGDATHAPAAVKWVHFRASAGASGRGPAGSYHIAIPKTGPNQSAYTCHDGLRAPTPTGDREQTLAAYSPEDEVQVLFVE